ILFPAFRFLQQRAKTNQRKIRLRHLILLLLRMLLIALLVLALARPRIFSRSGTTPFMPNQSVAAVLVFDTSRSMEYTAAGQTGPENEAQPRFVYVFSDRTVASWDPGRVGDLAAQRDRLPAPGVGQLYIDVGVEKPLDVAVQSVEVKPQSVPANREVVIKATVA